MSAEQSHLAGPDEAHAFGRALERSLNNIYPEFPAGLQEEELALPAVAADRFPEAEHDVAFSALVVYAMGERPRWPHLTIFRMPAVISPGDEGLLEKATAPRLTYSVVEVAGQDVGVKALLYVPTEEGAASTLLLHLTRLYPQDYPVDPETLLEVRASVAESSLNRLLAEEKATRQGLLSIEVPEAQIMTDFVNGLRLFPSQPSA